MLVGVIMSQPDTVDRILNAATILFAERGFAETSLRTITGMAEVNLASVNYHFGSKKELIQAVFSRIVKPFALELDRCLDQLEQDKSITAADTITTKQLVECMFVALLKATKEINEDPQRFMRLLGLAYTQSQEHLRHFIVGDFGKTYHRYTALLSQAQPNVDPVKFYWRLYFMLGAGVFTLSSFDAIRSILNTDFQADKSMDQVVELMVSSMVGILAPPGELTFIVHFKKIRL